MQTLSDQIKQNKDPTTYCPQVTHFKFKDTNSKRILKKHIPRKPQKTRVAIPIPDKMHVKTKILLEIKKDIQKL